MFLLEKELMRKLEKRTHELVHELETRIERTFSELSGVDKVTLTKLREIISDFYNAKAEISEISKRELREFTNRINEILDSADGKFNEALQEYLNGLTITEYIQKCLDDLLNSGDFNVDAEVTKEKIETVLGYTPAKQEDVDSVLGEIDGKQPKGDYALKSEIPTTLPASDVPSWAKASTKPSYTASEVGALPSTTKIPTKTSDLTNDSGFITGYTESDPTVPAWAKAASKPSYSKSEVGLGNVDNVKQYSTSNPPPYPVTSVNGKNGAVQLGAADIGAATSQQVEKLSEVIVNYHTPFANKKIVAIGDSIVQGTGDGAGGFLAALKNKYPDITTVNMGVGSTTFALNNSVPANASEGCIFQRIDNIPADADYIILQGGLNDFFHRDTYGVQFGEYVSNLHKYPINAYYDGSYHQLYYGAEYGGTLSHVFYQETFCGAFEMSLVKIMTRFYDKKYVLLIPHDPTGSAELTKYLDAEARICKKYGFPCIDLRLSAGMPRIKAIAGGSNGTSAFTADEAHPNMEGYTTQYLPAIERWLTDGSIENSVGAVTLAEVVQNVGGSSAVESVNGKTGDVQLNASDVGAISASEKVQITVKDADGVERTYELYGVLVSGGDTPSEPTDPNKVPTSVDTDGSIFNGVGYQDGQRFSISVGTHKAVDEGAYGTVTGYIAVDGSKQNDIYIGGYPWLVDMDYNIVCAYKNDASKTFIGSVTAKNGGTSPAGTVIYSSITDMGNNVTKVTLKAELNIAYIRVGYYNASNPALTGANLTVTVNEPIS